MVELRKSEKSMGTWLSELCAFRFVGLRELNEFFAGSHAHHLVRSARPKEGREKKPDSGPIAVEEKRFDKICKTGFGEGKGLMSHHEVKIYHVYIGKALHKMGVTLKLPFPPPLLPRSKNNIREKFIQERNIF